ncbi:MAG: hypothetical protein GX976_10200, partial [Bacteroidales bacterium]|nr:hypothetical protein [Bacteroidales bacterium]
MRVHNFLSSITLSLLVFSFATAEVALAVPVDALRSVATADTTDLFHDITDISRQIEKRTIVQQQDRHSMPDSTSVAGVGQQ